MAAGSLESVVVGRWYCGGLRLCVSVTSRIQRRKLSPLSCGNARDSVHPPPTAPSGVPPFGLWPLACGLWPVPFGLCPLGSWALGALWPVPFGLCPLACAL